MSFENYSDCIFNAFLLHAKQSEVIKRKNEILNGVSEYYNFSAESVLYIGFNPVIMNNSSKTIYVTAISQKVQNFLLKNKIAFTYIPENDLKNYYKHFDIVIALDEYFTFSSSDQEQKDKVTNICNITKEYIVTTCKDYKNQDFKDKEFSLPALIRGNSEIGIFIEFHDQNLNNRNAWSTKVFEIHNDSLTVFGGFERRALFFKQLAKFTADSGAVNFVVHKNLMYKSLIKKNYEHVISIQFENNGNR